MRIRREFSLNDLIVNIIVHKRDMIDDLQWDATMWKWYIDAVHVIR